MSAADGNALLSDVIGESADRLSAVVPASPSVAGIVAAGGAIMEEAGRYVFPLLLSKTCHEVMLTGACFVFCVFVSVQGWGRVDAADELAGEGYG